MPIRIKKRLKKIFICQLCKIEFHPYYSTQKFCSEMCRNKNLLQPLQSRLTKKYVIAENGCWVWTEGLKRGYGRFKKDGKDQLAHRVIYEIFKGKILEGFELDHLCRNKACVNPNHLEPVTHAENIKRSPIHFGSRTNCLKGHPYDESNTRINWNGGRECRICRKGYDKKHRDKKKLTSKSNPIIC